MDPDDLVDAVARAVVEARATSSVERSEERARRANQLHVQADFDGGIKGWFRYDPIVGAAVMNALDDAADAIAHATRTPDRADVDQRDGEGGGDPQADGSAGGSADADATDTANRTGTADPAHASDTGDAADADTTDADADGDGGWEWRMGRARQYATALERLARCWMSGGRDGTGRAKPLVVVHVDVADVHANAAGTVELNVRGALPSLTLRTLEALSTDADLRAVIFDGARPLAVSRKLALKDPSADTRFAVAARDRGDRWPGSRDPAAWCDVDHVRAREDGGGHHPDNLALLAPDNHRRKHEHGWQVSIDGATGMITITRRGTTFRSLPRGTPLSRPTATPPDARPPGGRPPDRTPRSGPPPPPGSPPPPRRTGPDPTVDPGADAGPAPQRRATPTASAADDTLPF